MRSNSTTATTSRIRVRSLSDSTILGKNEIHVWTAILKVSGPPLTTLFDTLSNDEKERADRFISEEARGCFVAGRGILRRLLAHYLATGPADIVFTYNRHGRPLVAAPAAANGIVFNLSHSANKALYAFSDGVPVGVDLERMRILDFAGISRRFFAPTEAAVLASLPERARSKAFFECWTRKEALTKAQGTGLHLELSRVEVSLGPDAPPRVVRIRGRERDAGDWSLYDIDVGRGFKAALAAKTRRARMVHLRYPADAARL